MNVASGSINRRTFLSGSIAAGALLIAGCSDTRTASPSRSAEPALLTSLRVGIPTDVLPALLLSFTPPNQPLRRTVFDYLIDLAPDGSYQPGLATAWEWNADGTELMLTLRQDVTFHTGRSFDADDVLFLMQSALVPEASAQVSALLKRGGMPRKVSAQQVAVTFETPFPRYLDALAALPVVDRDTYAQSKDGSKVVGTGPFTWTSWKTGKSLQLTGNKDYWGGAPSFDDVTFNVIKEPQAMLAALRSGDLDLVDRITPRDAATLKSSGGFFTQRAQGRDVYVGSNTTVAPLNDVRVRQAIAYSIDRDRIVDQVYSGAADTSSVPWPADTAGVTQDQVNRYSFDLDKAKALIQEAGVAGAEVAVTPSPADPAFKAIFDIVRYGLEQIGLKPNTVTFDAAEYPTRLQTGTLPGIFIGQVALTTMGPTTALLTAAPLRVNKNTHSFADADYPGLVDAVVSATDDAAHADAVAKATEFIVEQAFHNTVVQAGSPIAGVEGLAGVEVDVTQALRLDKATLRG